MDVKEAIVKHLEMVQGVINRLGHNSFLIKGWSMTILAAAILFIARSSIYSEFLILVFVVPIINFWILDGYFLWQERLFRGIYNDVRIKNSTNFEMDIKVQLKKPNNKWVNSIFSKTLNIFYITELSFIVFAFFVLRCDI